MTSNLNELRLISFAHGTVAVWNCFAFSVGHLKQLLSFDFLVCMCVCVCVYACVTGWVAGRCCAKGSYLSLAVIWGVSAVRVQPCPFLPSHPCQQIGPQECWLHLRGTRPVPHCKRLPLKPAVTDYSLLPLSLWALIVKCVLFSLCLRKCGVVLKVVCSLVDHCLVGTVNTWKRGRGLPS